MCNQHDKLMVRSSESLTSGQIKKTFGLQESTAKFIGACYKKGPDILALQVQTVQPELVGVNLWVGVPAEFEVYNFT